MTLAKWLALGAVVALGAALAVLFRPAREDNPQAPVAKVNGHVITRARLDQAVENAHLDRAKLSSDEQARFRQTLLAKLIDDLVISDRAQALHLVIPPDELAREMNRRFAKEAELDAYLARSKMTKQQVEESIATELRRQHVLAELMETPEDRDHEGGDDDENDRGTPHVGEREIADYYQEHQDSFRGPEEVRVSQIVARIEGQEQKTGPARPDPATPEEAKAQARAKVERAQASLAAGVTFAEVARQMSKDDPKSNSGDLGFVGPGRLPPPLEEQAFKLKPGEVSAMIETPSGDYLIKVEEKKPGRPRELSEVRGEIATAIWQRRAGYQVRAAMATLREQAHVEPLLTFKVGPGSEPPPLPGSPPRPAGDRAPTIDVQYLPIGAMQRVNPSPRTPAARAAPPPPPIAPPMHPPLAAVP
jgi:peptidyl-prolyl cis-trans isomerase SurA